MRSKELPPLRPGEIPSISVSGDTLPEAWEESVMATWELGTSIPTEYDQEIDPDSKDSTMMIVVVNPLKEPRIHLNLPDSLGGLEKYRQEVVDGISDYKVGETGYSYSYHDRMKNWPGIGSWDLQNIDQIDALLKKLAQTPHSRRAQAITWYPPIDKEHDEPPCLQRVWCRVVRSDKETYLLEMNTHWRSRDALKAAFMNMYALTDLQRVMAEKLSQMSRKRVEVGRYVDISDSYHIYGSYYRKKDMERFMQSIEKRTFKQRTMESDDPKALREFEKFSKKI